MTSASDDQFAEEATLKILPYLKTMSDFLAKFSRPISPAAVGAMSLSSLDVVNDTVDAEEENAHAKRDLPNVAALGLSNAASKALRFSPHSKSDWKVVRDIAL